MRVWVLALVVALMAAGCGKAGPPVAPQIRVPAPVTDLRGAVEQDAVALVWTNPQQRVDQSRLRDVSEVRVYRTEDEGIVPPKPALSAHGRVVGYQEIAVIPLGAPAPAVVQGHTVRFVDRDRLRFGRRYTYVVLAEDARGRVSPPSNRLSITFIAPPEAPPPPTVAAGDGEVRLRWRPPSRLLDGSAPGPLAYEVLRSGTAEAPPEAVFPQPVGQTEFVDKSVENERTYYYAVRAIRQDAGTIARGDASPRVAATPGRATPPAAPTNLVATPSAGTVRLSWMPSPDANVAGYVIYRAGPTGEVARVGSVRAPATTFTDRDLSPGIYRYAVTAQDGTARANESALSNEVSVTVP
jgi:fibronectin type 3 domain-containing protein